MHKTSRREEVRWYIGWCSGKVDGKTMVYDEEDGVTIELSALMASAGESGRSLSPEVPTLPEPHAQQPDEPIQPGKHPLMR